MKNVFQDYGMVLYYADYFLELFLHSLMRKKKDTYIVFDVGFNTGQFARLASECFKFYKSSGKIHYDAKLRIIAFEPNIFLANVAPTIEGLEIHTFALSNVVGKETLHIPLFKDEPNDLEKGALHYRNEYGGVYATSTIGNERKEDLERTMPNLSWQKLEVETTTLDKFCLENNIDEIDWLKLDVESFEKSVLQGSARMLNAGKIVCGQFEGDTSFNSTCNITTAIANNEISQQFIDECGMTLLDANYIPVTLPTTNKLIENEFFFITRKT